MKRLHQIEPEHIARLQPGQLVGLLRILLYAEARGGNVAVHVPTQIYVPDGGEDARWEGEVTPNEFIPNALTLFQSKAELLGPTACGNAMRRKDGSLVPAITEVLERNGAYVFFCREPYVQKGLTARIKAAHDAIVKAGKALGNVPPVRFLDGNKIAAWTIRHPAAVAYVSECCQLPFVGELRTWEDWSQDPACCGNFYSNAAIDTHIKSLREHLAEPRRIARVTGLSGLGKTRLAFEALRPPSAKENLVQASLNKAAAYLDMEHSPNGVLSLVSSIASAHVGGLLVVDNCERNQHDKLVEIVQRLSSQLSLLTLDYVPERSIPGILHVHLEPETMGDIIPKILKDLPQARQLSEAQISHVAAFANGFPQIAVLMVEAGDTLDLNQLNQKGLATRILWGRQAPVESTHKALCTLALFSHVGFEGDKAPQKTFVRTQLCGPPEPCERDFDQMLRPFLERRILQKAGAFRMVTPRPLAVALAADWWELAKIDELGALIPLIEAVGLTEFFCSRVRELHFSPNASALAAQLCGASWAVDMVSQINRST